MGEQGLKKQRGGIVPGWGGDNIPCLLHGDSTIGVRINNELKEFLGDKMFENREKELVKKLKAAEQELGVTKHKLKQRKDDKQQYKEETTKMRVQMTGLRSDLTLAYHNLEEKSQALITLKTAFQILQPAKEDKQHFKQVMSQ